MKKRLMILGLLVGLLTVTMLPGVTTAKSASAKADCKKGGWMVLVDENGESFTSEKDCKSYAKGGGTPMPPLPAGVLAIAFANLDGAPAYGPGDVLIAQWVDQNGSGAPDVGDVIEMGRFPLTFTPNGPAGFGSFADTSHTMINDVQTYDDGDLRQVRGHGDNGDFTHSFSHGSDSDSYIEHGFSEVEHRGLGARIDDAWVAGNPVNRIDINVHSVSRPSEAVALQDSVDDGDSAFIDVIIAY